MKEILELRQFMIILNCINKSKMVYIGAMRKDMVGFYLVYGMV
jgi:hypothetical protein